MQQAKVDYVQAINLRGYLLYRISMIQEQLDNTVLTKEKNTWSYLINDMNYWAAMAGMTNQRDIQQYEGYMGSPIFTNKLWTAVFDQTIKYYGFISRNKFYEFAQYETTAGNIEKRNRCLNKLKIIFCEMYYLVDKWIKEHNDVDITDLFSKDITFDKKAAAPVVPLEPMVLV